MRKQIKLSTISRKVQAHVDQIKQNKDQIIMPEAVDEIERYMAKWKKRWSKMFVVYGQFTTWEETHRFYISAPNHNAARAYIEKSYPNFKVEGVV